MRKVDIALMVVMFFVLGAVIGLWAGLKIGRPIGHLEFHGGQIVCQEKLDKQIECWRKDSLPK